MIGNIIGGGLLVGLIYWIIYLCNLVYWVVLDMMMFFDNFDEEYDS